MLRKIQSLLFALLFSLVSLGNPVQAQIRIISESMAPETTDTALDFLRAENILRLSEEFSLRQFISRSDFVRWSLRFNDFLGKGSEREPFQDVENNVYVAKAWQEGIVKTNPFFYPERPITGLEAIKVLLKAKRVEVSFPAQNQQILWRDFPQDTELQALVLKAVEMKVWEPVSGNMLGLGEYITGLEATQMLFAFKKYEEKNAPAEEGIKIPVYIPEENAEQSKIDYILETLNEQYFYSEKIGNIMKLEEAGIRAILEALADPYTSYADPQEQEEIAESRQGEEIVGIGAQIALNMESGFVFITQVFKGSSAERAGLQAGDTIIAVNGADVREKEAQEIANLIRGEAATIVQLRVLRNGNTREFSVTRQKFEVPFVEVAVENAILVTKLYRFEQKSVRDFQEKVVDAYAEAGNIEGMILDLRGNPGGDLRVVLEIMGFFFPKTAEGENYIGIWVNERDALSKQRVIGDGEFADIPLVLLLNRYSASGSEVFAGAVQDYERGKILGEQSFGKGTVQNNHLFADGSLFRFTIAEWLTPDKRAINGIGITPDILVSNGTGFGDTVLEAAKNMIRRGQVQQYSGTE